MRNRRLCMDPAGSSPFRGFVCFAVCLCLWLCSHAQGFQLTVSMPDSTLRQATLSIYEGGDPPRRLTHKAKKKSQSIEFTGTVASLAYAELSFSNSAVTIPFFIENSDISITVIPDNPQASPIKGSRSNSLSRFLFEQYSQQGDITPIADFVDKNPTSPVASYLLYQISITDTCVHTIDKLASRLYGPARETPHFVKLQLRLMAPPEGSRMPDFIFTGDDGKARHLDSLLCDTCHNLIVVGATWCSKCGEIISQVKSAHPEVNTIVVNIDNDKASWDALFMTRLYIDHIPYMILLDPSRTIMARDARVWQLDKLLRK